MDKISLMLVDDHKLIRESWSFLLNTDSRFQVIAESGNGEEAIELAKEQKPKFILSEIIMCPLN